MVESDWQLIFRGERFRGKSEKGVEKSKVAAGNGPSIANQRLLQYVTWKRKKWNEMDQLPRTEMQTNNLKWSVRGKINADAKKGNVEKKSKFTVFAANIAGSIRGNPFAEIQPRKSGHGNPTAEIHSRKSIRGNPGNQANYRKEDPLKIQMKQT